MTPLVQMTLVLFSAFFQVFLLGLNSKLLRDDKVAASFVVSWLITLAQFGFIWAVANNQLSTPLFLFISGWGGSLGIVSCQYLYKWYDERRLHNVL